LQGGISEPSRSEGLIPLDGGSGGKRGPDRGSGENPPKEKFLVNVYCNFIINLTVHYKVTDLMVEVMLGFFPLEGNPLL
jgi:hypothetical protein